MIGLEFLITASLITAFIAGIAALFAPCCITVLLPAYLGSIFKQRKTVFLMTSVFFLGLSAVFLPLGFGIAWLGQIFSQYHNAIFAIGGLFLVSLGAFILLGGHFSMPFRTRSSVKVSGAASVFTLGVFSGFATLCCAPVLAGVFALSILPGSILLGGLYSLAYVLGMVLPLFFIAYFMDKRDFTKKFYAFKKPLSYRIGGTKIDITLADAIAGATFLLMGILVLYLSGTNQIASHSSYQTTINIYMAELAEAIKQYAGWVPDYIFVLLIISSIGAIAWKSFKMFRTETTDNSKEDE